MQYALERLSRYNGFYGKELMTPASAESRIDYFSPQTDAGFVQSADVYVVVFKALVVLANCAYEAAEHGQTECLVWLLDSGANICLRDNKSQTAIDVARFCKQTNAFRILRKQAIEEGLVGTQTSGVTPVKPLEAGQECEEERLSDEDLLPIDFPFGDTEAVGLCISAERKHAARDLALRRIDLLLRHLELAKLDFKQLGGSTAQLEKRNIPTEEREELKVATLDSQLEYERLRREKLELALDKARREVLMLKSGIKDSSFALKSPLCSAKREQHVNRPEKAYISRIIGTWKLSCHSDVFNIGQGFSSATVHGPIKWMAVCELQLYLGGRGPPN
nr:unnamed protein product [Spirometra erinaceieuropaei]